MKKIHVNSNVQVTEGAQAAKLLENNNDLLYFDEEDGVKEVDFTRWKLAQGYEEKTWLKLAQGVSDDRNFDHERNFGGYAQLNEFLPSNPTAENGLSVIELGCGPFTNLRLLFTKVKRNWGAIHLLDPLIDKYKAFQRNCTYKDGMLNFKKVMTWNLPIEEFNPLIKYDLVVMVNVLEHCWNADLIFEKIEKMLSKDGIFVFADIFIKDKYNREWTESVYDTGHPIKLSRSYLDKQLEKYQVLNSNIVDEEEREVHYLILKKK